MILVATKSNLSNSDHTKIALKNSKVGTKKIDPKGVDTKNLVLGKKIDLNTNNAKIIVLAVEPGALAAILGASKRFQFAAQQVMMTGCSGSQ